MADEPLSLTVPVTEPPVQEGMFETHPTHATVELDLTVFEKLVHAVASLRHMGAIGAVRFDNLVSAKWGVKAQGDHSDEAPAPYDGNPIRNPETGQDELPVDPKVLTSLTIDTDGKVLITGREAHTECEVHGTLTTLDALAAHFDMPLVMPEPAKDPATLSGAAKPRNRPR